MRSRLLPLIRIFYNPLQAMIDLQAGAPYLVGCVLALLATFFYYEALNGTLAARILALADSSGGTALIVVGYLFSSFLKSAATLLFLAIIFIPACLLAVHLLARRSSFGVLLRQEYAPVGACVLYAWTAAHLMMLVPALLVFEARSGAEAVLRYATLPYFLFLVMLALRAALRLAYGRAAAAAALACVSFVALPLSGGIFFVLASPFLSILLLIGLLSFFSRVLGAQRARENFRQGLEAATLNPADASAHYNLGLLYQRRNQYAEAQASFRRAIQIDPDEVDAYYQLGRIAREEGRLAEAIEDFDAVVRRSPSHSQHEVWREIGRAYLQAGQYEDGRAAFERFLDARASDAEGRYHYALTLYSLGQPTAAAAEMQAVVEAVRTSPGYKYRAEKQWLSEAQAFLRSQEARGQ